MFAAYTRIFERLGLQFRAVAADTGAIGGDRSHEFQVIADTGRRRHRLLPHQRLRRQHRAGRGRGPDRPAPPPTAALAKVATPGKSTCPDVAELLGLP
jgi:prolyl-tRNA synthetase